MAVTLHSVTESRFADLAALFEARGGPDYCWCMGYRARKDEASDAKGAEGRALRKGQLQARLAGGEHIGLLAYEDGRPVGWCSTGPLGTFARFGAGKGLDGAGTWAISCYYIARDRRGQGIAKALAIAALEAARGAGAARMLVTGVEADSPSYRFMGRVSMYRELGFTETGMAGIRRHVMELAL